MACFDLDSSQLLSNTCSFDTSVTLHFERSASDKFLAVPNARTSTQTQSVSNIPKPPPLPGASGGRNSFSEKLKEETRRVWDKLFCDGYEADVRVVTDDDGVVLAHSSVLGINSPVLRSMLQQVRAKDGFRCIRIPGVPTEAARVFIRFLYSSCFDRDAMKGYVLHLLVMSHAFSVPCLKMVCVSELEQALLTADNVVDVLQLARQCDAPRLALLCTRLIVKDFKTVSASEGWKVMKQVSRSLEQELLESLVEADSVSLAFLIRRVIVLVFLEVLITTSISISFSEEMQRKVERAKKAEERKVYMQLHEAMEALVHICRDGCRTIGPRDKMLKDSQAACNFPACKGLELLVRHFSGCRTRIPGGCPNCKRMWQLLELHSRMCDEPDSCKVPLCRHFKDKMQNLSKKEEMKWKLLVSKVMEAKGTISAISARRHSIA